MQTDSYLSDLGLLVAAQQGSTEAEAPTLPAAAGDGAVPEGAAGDTDSATIAVRRARLAARVSPCVVGPVFDPCLQVRRAAGNARADYYKMAHKVRASGGVRGCDRRGRDVVTDDGGNQSTTVAVDGWHAQIVRVYLGGGYTSSRFSMVRRYQIKGLEWMVSLYNNNLNGILGTRSAGNRARRYHGCAWDSGRNGAWQNDPDDRPDMLSDRGQGDDAAVC